LLLVNLLLLASLEKRSIHEEFDCFLGAEDGDSLEGDNLVDKVIGDEFFLFWEAAELPAEKALPCF